MPRAAPNIERASNGLPEVQPLASFDEWCRLVAGDLKLMPTDGSENAVDVSLGFGHRGSFARRLSAQGGLH
jgi:hypothetical protein